MARGQELKQKITQKILETFPDSFINEKEIRICGEENGETLQIKVTLTAAKENISNPATDPKPLKTILPDDTAITSDNIVEVNITSEEKKTVAQLLAGLGL